MGWLSGWDYRKSHVINSQAGAGTNYQVCIKVYYGAGVDGTETVYGVPSGKVYCNSKCQTDFEDIRFTDDDGSTLLDCWLQEKVDSNYAIFWVEIADSLESSNQSIYVYYGKADATYPYLATDLAQGQATFISFDDFEADDALAGWTADSGTWSEATDTLRKTANAATWQYIHITSSNKANISIQAKYKPFSVGATAPLMGFLFYGTDAQNCYALLFDTNVHCIDFYLKVADGWARLTTVAFIWVANQTYNVRVSIEGQVAKAYIDGVLKNSYTFDGTYTTGIYGFAAYGASAAEVDIYYVRKYVVTEPAHSTWGSEEDGRQPSNPTNIAAVCNGLSQIDVTWDDNATQETAYYIERDDGGWHQLNGALPADTESYNDNTIVCDVTYKYQVRAYNSLSGLYSNYVTMVAGLRCCLLAPSNIAASCTGVNQITITWNDNCGVETAYKIERDDSGWHEIDSIAAGSTSYIDNTIACDVTYKYRVRCTDGTIYSSYDTVAVGVRCCLAPPTNIAAGCVGSTRIDITWNDNCGVETGYRIERNDGGWHEIAAIAAGSIAYSDVTITCGVAYLYRVRCTDGTLFSTYDTLAVAVTCTCPIPPTPPTPPPPVTPQVGGKPKRIRKGQEPYEYSYDFMHKPIEQVIASINYPFKEGRKVKAKIVKRFAETITINSRVVLSKFSETITVNASVLLKFTESTPIMAYIVKKFKENGYIKAIVYSMFKQKLEVFGETVSFKEDVLSKLDELFEEEILNKLDELNSKKRKSWEED